MVAGTSTCSENTRGSCSSRTSSSSAASLDTAAPPPHLPPSSERCPKPFSARPVPTCGSGLVASVTQHYACVVAAGGTRSSRSDRAYPAKPGLLTVSKPAAESFNQCRKQTVFLPMQTNVRQPADRFQRGATLLSAGMSSENSHAKQGVAFVLEPRRLLRDL